MRVSLFTFTVLFPLLALAEDDHPEIPTTRTLTSTLTRTTTISTTASVTETISTIVSAYPTMYPSNSTAPMGTATAPHYIPSGGMTTTTAKSGPSTSTGKPAPTNFPGSGAETLERNKLVMGAAALMAVFWMI